MIIAKPISRTIQFKSVESPIRLIEANTTGLRLNKYEYDLCQSSGCRQAVCVRLDRTRLSDKSTWHISPHKRGIDRHLSELVHEARTRKIKPQEASPQSG